MITFPPAVEGEEVYLIAINASLVPVISGIFAKMCNRYVWESDEDHEQGYNAFTYLRGCMLSCPLSKLIESNNQLYRLIDRAYNGTEYSVVTVDPLVIEPAIPVIPENEPVYPGVVWQVGDVRAKLVEVIAKLDEGGELDADVLEQLVIIAGLVV